jgi:Asp-tRNA(Asn)/Glu-tRNA(Gln) amidotransferase A subunit family amidase
MDALEAAALKSARIGILEPLFGDASDDQEVIRIVRASIEEFKKEGATAVSVPMPELIAALDGSSVINAEFKEDLANYLAKNGNPPVHSLEEMVRGGLVHFSLEAVLNTRLASKGRDSREYKIALAKRALFFDLVWGWLGCAMAADVFSASGVTFVMLSATAAEKAIPMPRPSSVVCPLRKGPHPPLHPAGARIAPTQSEMA